jgi:hypothetical protein
MNAGGAFVAIAVLLGAFLLLSGSRTMWAGFTSYSVFGMTLFEAQVWGAVMVAAGLALLITPFVFRRGHG